MRVRRQQVITYTLEGLDETDITILKEALEELRGAYADEGYEHEERARAMMAQLLNYSTEAPDIAPPLPSRSLPDPNEDGPLPEDPRPHRSFPGAGEFTRRSSDV